MSVPFDGLRPAPSRTHTRWVVDAMGGRDGVARVVPDTFDAYARIHHRIHNGERWADFAPEYLVRGIDAYHFVGSKLEFIDGDGNLDAVDVDALVSHLTTATTTPSHCHFALWGGWGWWHPGSMHRRSTAVVSSAQDAAGQAQALQTALETELAAVWSFAGRCPVESWWGGRDMILFDGPIDAVSRIGRPNVLDEGMQRQCPQWWWPEDHAWFVGTEIDDPWTYVAGSRTLIEAIVASRQWESIRVESTDRW